jgi:hypothetical protein
MGSRSLLDSVAAGVMEVADFLEDSDIDAEGAALMRL